MAFTGSSPRVKECFIALDHFLEADLLTENERFIINDLNNQFPTDSKYWTPIP
jgi:hypothetical protein